MQRTSISNAAGEETPLVVSGNNNLDMPSSAETPTETKTFWQSYKHIIKPIAAITTVAVAIGTTLAVVFSRHTSPSEPESPDSLSASWMNFDHSPLHITAEGNLQNALEQLGSYLFNAANMTSAMLALLSSSHKMANPSTSVCSSQVMDLRETLDSTMQEGGRNIIYPYLNMTHTVSCTSVWTHAGRLEGLSCKYLTLAESVFANIGYYVNKMVCSTSSLLSDPGFIQISFYLNEQNVIWTVEGLPQNYQTLTKERSLSQSYYYPTSDCEFYVQYLAEHPQVATWLNGTTCNVSTNLDLSNNNIGPEGAAALAPALQQLTSLRSLSLNNNSLGSQGVEALAPALQQLTTMLALCLHSNNIGPEGAAALALILPRPGLNQNWAYLYKLDLSNNNIGPEGAAALAPVLRRLSLHTLLDLSNNNIGPEGIKALAPALQEVRSETLDLSNNNIGPEGAAALSLSIQHRSVDNTQDPKSLSLNNNNIGPEGIKALAPALKLLWQLRGLYLNNNSIDDIGATTLGSALEHLQYLGRISVEGNDISLAGCTNFTNDIHIGSPRAEVLCD